jgi:hypothetical protein
MRIGGERVLHKAAVAFRAKVEGSPLELVFVGVGISIIFDSFEDGLNLGQMVPIIVALIGFDRLECGMDFKLEDIPHFFLRINCPPAAVAGIMNHENGPECCGGCEEG